MTPRIRIIYQQQKPLFSERLERRAEALVREAAARKKSLSRTQGALEQQIAFTLGRLASTRRAHEAVRSDLTRLELFLETEIIQRTPRPPVYADPRLPERDMLRARLLTLAAERRRLALTEAQALGELHERLLELMLKSEMVRG